MNALSPRRPAWLALSATLLALSLAAGAPAFGDDDDDDHRPQRPPTVSLWLTVLHNNDGESKLLSPASNLADYGGIARFVTLMDQLRAAASDPRRGDDDEDDDDDGRKGPRRAAIVLSSGDNFLAGPEFNASLTKGPPFYDSVGIDLIDYDALAIGNHEFDFGPDVLADLIGGTQTRVPFLSANLDVSDEPRLARLERKGRIADSVVVRKGGTRIGVIGATTELLPFISSPRNAFPTEVLAAVRGEVARLKRRGVDIIILISHLQGIAEELALIPQLTDVDLVIAGGGSELLVSNPATLLVPGESFAARFGPYPIQATDAAGRVVPVVTTEGNYKYIGRLVLGFDRKGNLLEIDPSSDPVRVSGVAPDAVQPDPEATRRIVEPVTASIAALASNIIASSQVRLDGRRSSVRRVETNEGNLVADALLWQANTSGAGQGLPTAQIAFQNGGGIRNDAVIPAGNISELNTFQILPFTNFVSVLPSVPRTEIKAVLENAVSRVEFSDGRFAQIAGFRFTYDISQPAGSRVREATLDDGTPLVSGGNVVAGAGITVATIDFLARQGDQYPFTTAFVNVGASYQQALANYIVDGLSGQITAAGYPEGGEGRITCTRSASTGPTCPVVTL